MATLSWGASGPEVESLQRRLREAGHFFGTLDGRFGSQTFAAVRRFQQAQGLTVDGIAGPQTLAALDRLGSGPDTSGGGGGGSAGDGVGGGQALSLHIGINRVDPSRYGGWDGALSGCEQDARTMTSIAAAEGFTTRQLFSRDATSRNILAEISRAAQALQAGGTFLLTYAGHGGQVADLGDEEESDELDETWVAYDEQVLDDTLAQAYSAFRPGVRLVVISDSCHSGTVNRRMPAFNDAYGSRRSAETRAFQQQVAELKGSFYTALTTSRSDPTSDPVSCYPRPASAPPEPESRTAGTRVLALAGSRATTASSVFAPPVFADDRSAAEPEAVAYATRNLPWEVNEKVNNLQRPRLVERKQRARSRGTVRAHAVLLSGCADNQLSQEVGGAGVFTTTLHRVWANNQFSGNYQTLVASIVSQMGPTQTPQLVGFGEQPELLLHQTPFNSV